MKGELGQGQQLDVTDSEAQDAAFAQHVAR